jgi:hypothetical protein
MTPWRHAVSGRERRWLMSDPQRRIPEQGQKMKGSRLTRVFVRR